MSYIPIFLPGALFLVLSVLCFRNASQAISKNKSYGLEVLAGVMNILGAFLVTYDALNVLLAEFMLILLETI